MTSKEARQTFADTFDTIIGRNIYDEDLRQYVYTTYSGKYYSDCSSAGCATFNKIGQATSLLNTAGMYNSSLFEKVDVVITDGHIADSEFSKLRQADALMYVGNDASRPLQIGHVEYIHTLGTGEAATQICGHGSNTPSYKNMKTYNTSRQAALASNGKAKGLICVLRRISDDGSEVETKSGWYEENGGWRFYLGDTGEYVKNDWYLDDDKWYWFDGAGMMVSNIWYQYDGAWYYLGSDGAMVKGLQDIDDKWYYLDADGVMATEPVTLTPDDNGALQYPDIA